MMGWDGARARSRAAGISSVPTCPTCAHARAGRSFRKPLSRIRIPSFPSTSRAGLNVGQGTARNGVSTLTRRAADATVLSRVQRGPRMAKTPVELFRLGNARYARLDALRNADVIIHTLM